jgi:hypothetical protein
MPFHSTVVACKGDGILTHDQLRTWGSLFVRECVQIICASLDLIPGLSSRLQTIIESSSRPLPEQTVHHSATGGKGVLEWQVVRSSVPAVAKCTPLTSQVVSPTSGAST